VKQEKNVKREAQMGGAQEVKHEVPEHVEYEVNHTAGII
jgi:hypothetical protein